MISVKAGLPKAQIFWSPSGVEIENRIAFRRERQIKILEATRPKQLEFVFTDDALNSGPEDRGVVREELGHLLHLQNRYPNIKMQAVRAGGVQNPAPNGGITVLDFGNSAPRVAFAPIVYGPSTYFDDENDTAALLRAFKRTQQLARSHDATAELIRQRLRED